MPPTSPQPQPSTPPATARRLSPRLNELGSTGLNQQNGFIRDDFLRELNGLRAQKIYREMAENHSTIGACLFAIEKLAGQVDWRVEAFDQSPGNEDEQRKEFLEGAIFRDMDRPWSETISEALTMIPYGHCELELNYKKREGPDKDEPLERSAFSDGLVGWSEWAPRAQDTIYRWLFNEKRKLIGLVQKTADLPEVSIPMEKLLHFRASTKRGNPEGKSCLRIAYVDWYFQRRLKEIEGIGIERDLAGLPVMTGPENVDLWNASDTNASLLWEEAKKIVTSIRVDEQMGVVMPHGWTLELLSAVGKKSIDAGAVITRYDQRIAMALLADFMLIGHEKVGTQALAGKKLTAFAMAITSFLDHIAEVVNRTAVPRLWRLNGWPLDRMPKLVHGEVEDVNLTELGEYIGKLAAAGVPLFPNPNLEEHLHTVAKLPAPTEGFEARAEMLQEQEEEQRTLEQELLRQRAASQQRLPMDE